MENDADERLSRQLRDRHEFLKTESYNNIARKYGFSVSYTKTGGWLIMDAVCQVIAKWWPYLNKLIIDRREIEIVQLDDALEFIRTGC